MDKEEKLVPDISVIMAVYNEPLEWIAQSVNSILKQTYSNFEFIIINDNPLNDATINLLKSFSEDDSRVVLIFNDNNIGLTKSLNRGLRLARGKYIARMDADDFSYPSRFMEQYSYLEKHPEIILLGTNVEYFGNHSFFHFDDMMKFDNESIKAELLMRNCIIHSSVFIRKEVLRVNDIIYDEDFRQSQDYRLWESLYDIGKFENLKKVLVRYRFSNQQITTKFKNNQNDLAKKITISIQKKWLNKYGIDVSEEELKSNPFAILDEVKKIVDAKQTKQYRVFVQYCYLQDKIKSDNLCHFLKGDWKCFTFFNLIRLFIRTLSK